MRHLIRWVALFLSSILPPVSAISYWSRQGGRICRYRQERRGDPTLNLAGLDAAYLKSIREKLDQIKAMQNELRIVAKRQLPAA
jgi:hypothetical protein